MTNRRWRHAPAPGRRSWPVLAAALPLVLASVIFTYSVGSADTGPAIATQPTSQMVNEGQVGVAFTAVASGDPAPTVQWQLSTDGGTTFTNDLGSNTATAVLTEPGSITASVQLIVAAQAADNGHQFRAVFTNSAGSATTNAATLTVNFAPVITLQPVDQTVNAGQLVTFSAAASANPPVDARWQASRNGGATWNDILPFGATTPSLTIAAGAANNGLLLRAVFDNGVGTATSNVVTLTVNFAPTVTTQPVSRTVNTSQSVSFNASANGNPVPTVQWQQSVDRGATFTDVPGATSATLTLAATLTADNGHQFRAVFTNSVGSATSQAATLTVNFAPAVTTDLTDQTVCDGASAAFTAAATGNPVPTVQWQLTADHGVSFSDISGATSPTLAITARAADNGHQFRAVFTNSLGVATTDVATLTVNSPPLVTTQPVSQTIQLGETVIFTAAASGVPAPTVQWQVSADGGATFTNVLGATGPTLSFTAQTADNGNQFRAVFANTCGTANTQAATLTAATPTATPTVTPTPTATSTATPTASALPTLTLSATPTITPSPPPTPDRAPAVQLSLSPVVADQPVVADKAAGSAPRTLGEYCHWEPSTNQWEIRHSADVPGMVALGDQWPVAPHVCAQTGPPPP